RRSSDLEEYLAKFYALIDVLVIPWKSLPFSELVPTMDTVEALAYGKRLVLSNLAVLEECAQKYECVLTFAVGSAISLAQSLQHALSLPVPKPSAELLLSAHTERMVMEMKGRQGQQGREREPKVEPITPADPMIELAMDLAQQKVAAITSIEGRVAVVASHTWNADESGYAKR